MLVACLFENGFLVVYLRPAFAAGRARLLLRERGRARRGGWGSAAPQHPSLFQSFYFSLTSAGIMGPAALAGEPQHVRHAHIPALPACSRNEGVRACCGRRRRARGVCLPEVKTRLVCKQDEGVSLFRQAHVRMRAERRQRGSGSGGLRRWTLPLPGHARSVAIKTKGSQRERGPDFRGGASQAGHVQERSAFDKENGPGLHQYACRSCNDLGSGG